MDPAQQTPTPERKMVSRRALLRVGWVVPVILAVGIPHNAFASYGGPPTDGGGGQTS